MTSPLTLYLLRHGKSVANAQRLFSARKTDPPLSALGVEQAAREEVATRLKPFLDDLTRGGGGRIPTITATSARATCAPPPK